MKLTTMTQVTIDGVMQGNGAASDDRRNGFERGGWARGKGDNETQAFIKQTYQRADAFLFGRRTYELFAGSWGSYGTGCRWLPVRRGIEQAPKYVASTTLTDPAWSDTTVLRGDLAAAISELKAKPGGELQVHGSGILTRWLLENDLVDEMTLIVDPGGSSARARDCSRSRPGSCARPGRVARRLQGRDDPGLPAGRAPAVCANVLKSLTTKPRCLDTTGDDLQMQYLVSVIDDKSHPGSTDRQPAISAFNERLIAEGYWVFAGGLADTDAATVIDNRGEQAVFSDGPFVESKEYLAGVWVWEAPDLDVALKLATEASKVCDRKIEVRPFQ